MLVYVLLKWARHYIHVGGIQVYEDLQVLKLETSHQKQHKQAPKVNNNSFSG